jgi:hypothetical protein
MVRRGSLWCGVAHMVQRGSYGAAWLLWCGVAQLIERWLAVRQALVRFSARHHREFFPTELTSDDEIERPRRMAMGKCIE